jgi:prophage antirepressor-like protein
MNEIFKTLEEGYIKYNSRIITVIIDNHDMIWFNGKETCGTLGYTNHMKAIRVHTSKNDKIQLQNIIIDKYKGHPHSLYLNEAGLYKLIMRSKLPSAKKFTDWVTYEVLPSIRKYGFYKLNKEYENKIKHLNIQIKRLKTLKKNCDEENTKIKRDLKKETFPTGGLVYVIDFSTSNKEIYRIGMTTNMKNRKEVTNSHTLHKKPIVHYSETTCPKSLESCVISLLDNYRYRDRKDFFICPLKKIKIAFNSCVSGNKKINTNKRSNSKTNRKNQIGGSNEYTNIISKKLDHLISNRDKLKIKVNKLSIKIKN